MIPVTALSTSFLKARWQRAVRGWFARRPSRSAKRVLELAKAAIIAKTPLWIVGKALRGNGMAVRAALSGVGAGAGSTDVIRI